MFYFNQLKQKIINFQEKIFKEKIVKRFNFVMVFNF